mgnify:CR=1 FL=1
MRRPGGEPLASGHTQFTSVVTKKAGAFLVTTPDGAIHQLNENMARRHGQEPFKAGDAVMVSDTNGKSAYPADQRQRRFDPTEEES